MAENVAPISLPTRVVIVDSVTVKNIKFGAGTTVTVALTLIRDEIEESCEWSITRADMQPGRGVDLLMDDVHIMTLYFDEGR